MTAKRLSGNEKAKAQKKVLLSVAGLVFASFVSCSIVNAIDDSAASQGQEENGPALEVALPKDHPLYFVEPGSGSGVEDTDDEGSTDTDSDIDDAVAAGIVAPLGLPPSDIDSDDENGGDTDSDSDDEAAGAVGVVAPAEQPLQEVDLDFD